MSQITPINPRASEFAVDPLFLDRWSPRAFDGAPISAEQLLTILDAAHWAPSAFNSQPWRFVYALKGTPEWDRLLGLLVDFNQGWARDAGALVFIVSKTHFAAPGATEEKLSHSHSFDAGAAWALLALQARLSGLHAHGMSGIHFDKVNEALNIPAGYRVEAAVAIGALGDKAKLPEMLRERETPSPRRPLAELVFNGALGAS